MNLIRIAAGLPRRLPDIRNTSLTTRTAVVVALIGLSVWLLLDLVYQQSAQRDLSARLQQQLHTAAVTERGRIHKSLASFRATARYLANYQPLHQRLRSWNRTGTHTLPAISQWQPDWLPGTRSMDERIGLDVATVLGKGRETHAVYGNGRRTVAGIFLQPDIAMLQGAMDGLRVHVEDGVAYLVSAAPVQGEDGQVLGSVLIAARIDRRFLAGIVDTPAAHTVSGLVLGNRAPPLALLGPAADAARSDYRIGGADELDRDPQAIAGPAQTLSGLMPGPWAILIGPEGGFSEDERTRLRRMDCASPISLGPRILRADTAAVAALTLWQSALGDWE